MTKISIFGLGYVGAVSAAALAELGHEVCGVDVNPAKVDMIKAGRSPVIETGLAELMHSVVESGQLYATTNTRMAVFITDVSLICVGTPSQANGNLDLTYVERVCRDIGAALADKNSYHVVVARSTMLPGSTENVVIPILEQVSGKKAGHDFGVCFNPEFLREGSSLQDFYDPPFTIVGGNDARATAVVKSLYASIEANPFIVPIKTAEMIKYACNAFHALKVSFANEIGNICKGQDIDSHQVMDIFCQDTRLNISPYYLKPGFAFGGSCLPKDLRALLYHARHYDLNTPVLESILYSNRRQIERAYDIIRGTGHKRIGVLGFSFKAGTDDLRESPMVELVERLIGKGYHVRLYDKNVSLANLQGANRAYIKQEIPHIASLMCSSVEGVMAESEVIIIGNKAPEFGQALAHVQPGQIVMDLVRITEDTSHLNGQYQGICW